jgi:hypothetical protein
MNEAVITIKLSDSEVNLLTECLTNTTLDGVHEKPIKKLTEDFLVIQELVKTERRKRQLLNSRKSMDLSIVNPNCEVCDD